MRKLLVAVATALLTACAGTGLDFAGADGKPVLSQSQRTVAEAKITLAAVYDTIASRKRRGLITDAERNALVAKADEGRAALAIAKDGMTTPQAVLILLEELERRLR